MNHSWQTAESHELQDDQGLAYSLGKTNTALNEPRQVILTAPKQQNRVEF